MHTKREKEVKLERRRTSPYFHTHFSEANKRGKVELSATSSIQFSSSVQQDRKQQEHHPFNIIHSVRQFSKTKKTTGASSIQFIITSLI
jgi:hypothetical protein